jgi:hypothetical protein
MIVRTISTLTFAAALHAQTVCPPTPQYTPCDLIFDGPSDNLQAEFRSPRFNSGIVKAFSDGGTRWIIRITPAEAGTYTYKLSNGKEGTFTATPNNKTGWLRAANVHHFAFVDGENKLTPHLWMGSVEPGFAGMDIASWKQLVEKRASQRFNHIGITLVDDTPASANFKAPEFFQTAEEKIRYANQHDIIVDIAFSGPDGLLNRLLPTRDDRKKWFTYAISRLAGFDVTWQGIEAWETYDNARDLLKEIAEYLSDLDPYKHTRSTRTLTATGALADDGWLRYRSYQTGDAAIGAVEQQVYQYPAVNNFSVGATDTDTFRHRLWNAAMSGQYPSAAIPGDQAANQMKIWYDLISASRHWELEPFFDVEGGRGLALGGIEYLIYAEKPGAVTVHMENHGYDAAWFNPITGQFTKIKEVKGEAFTGEPPDKSHDWVLRLSREGTKAGMLKSYKFDSQEIILQTVEGNPEKVPFTIDIALPRYAVKLTRQTKAMQNMTYEWTGEVSVDGRGYRVIGTGAEGTFQIPANIAKNYPASLHIKVTALNGLGKAYTLDRNETLTK